MACSYSELSLESVKDFMVVKGGRVTNHELVKQFKRFLTNVDDVEEARYRFKKYVNTLANISQEGGEKYLVLKRVHRVGTPLEVDEYPSPIAGAQPHFPGSPSSSFSNTPLSYSPVLSPLTQPSFGAVSSPGNSSPGIPPPYRAPPPYRPPPEPGVLPQTFGRDEYASRQMNLHLPRSRGSDSALSSDVNNPSYKGQDCRRSSYQDPHDLGIPPARLAVRSSSSSSLLQCGDSSSLQGKGVTGAHPYPKVLPFSGNARSSDTLTSDPNEFNTEPLSASASRSSLSHTVSLSSVSSLDDPMPPAVPPRKRFDNKENLYPPQDLDIKFREGSASSEGGLDCVSSGSSSCRSSMASMEDDRKISVKETTQKFNKMASEAFLISGRSTNKAGRANRSDREDDECPPLSSFGPEGQEWLVAAARSDFNEILRLLKIRPILARYRDLANGYTALHWAAKHGRAEVIKLLYGTYHVDVNSRSNGGYTPLHLAAMYNRHDAFDLLTHYGADLNLRDYSGKKPRQYQATASSTVSVATQNRIVRRRNSLKESGGFLRIGSLNVKVRKTTEAFNSLLSRDVEARLHRNWGSSDSLPETQEKDSKFMPPPKIVNLKKRKTNKKDREAASTTPKTTPSPTPTPTSTPSATPTATPAVTPTSHRSDSLSINTSFMGSNQDSDSDSAYGFGTDWNC